MKLILIPFRIFIKTLSKHFHYIYTTWSTTKTVQVCVNSLSIQRNSNRRGGSKQCTESLNQPKVYQNDTIINQYLTDTQKNWQN